MTSIFRLDGPCPCGSKDTHGTCCAPGKRRLWRRITERFGARPAHRETSSRRRKLPVALGAPEMARLLEFVEDFSSQFADVINTGSAWLREVFGEHTTAQMLDHLEVVPKQALTPPVGLLLRSYGVFRAARPYGGAAAEDMVRHVRRRRGEAGAAIFAAMDEAHLGAWEVSRTRSSLIATRIDGTEEPLRRTLDIFTDYEWSAITTPGFYAGWLVEDDDASMLFFATEYDEEAAARLRRTAARAPWGCREPFRSGHYEEDVLALLARPDCFDTGCDDARSFLSPEIKNVWYLRPSRLAEDVANKIEIFGLRSLAFVDGANAFGDHGPADPDRYTCPICDRTHRKNAHKAPGWSVDVAIIGEDCTDAIVAQLEAMRADALPKSTTWHYTNLAGRHSLEYLLPTDEMLAMIALGPSGRIDHPRLGGADDYLLATLDVDAEAFRKAGFDLNWSIGQARSWARQHAPDELHDELEAAAARHKTALRWACLVDRHRQIDLENTVPIRYAEFYWGVRKLLPTAALETPLSALREEKRGTWRRIEKAMREQDGFDAPQLRLGHLPTCLHSIEGLIGVGPKSVTALVDGLRDFVANWPDSAGYSSIATSAEMQEAAGDALASGLDELDDLF